MEGLHFEIEGVDVVAHHFMDDDTIVMINGRCVVSYKRLGELKSELDYRAKHEDKFTGRLWLKLRSFIIKAKLNT